MTTIASDGVTIAADGLALLGDEPVRTDTKKIVSLNGRVFGFTGSHRFQNAAINWVLAGCKPEDHPAPKDKEDAWTVAEYFPDFVMAYNDSCPYPFSYHYPFAIGSGQDYASGAMAAGATPEEAVRIAMKFNVRTGGDVVVLSVPQASTLREAAE